MGEVRGGGRLRSENQGCGDYGWLRAGGTSKEKEDVVRPRNNYPINQSAVRRFDTQTSLSCEQGRGPEAGRLRGRKTGEGGGDPVKSTGLLSGRVWSTTGRADGDGHVSAAGPLMENITAENGRRHAIEERRLKRDTIKILSGDSTMREDQAELHF